MEIRPTVSTMHQVAHVGDPCDTRDVPGGVRRHSAIGGPGRIQSCVESGVPSHLPHAAIASVRRAPEATQVRLLVRAPELVSSVFSVVCQDKNTSTDVPIARRFASILGRT